MRITFHQCKVFESIAHEKSITRAAKKMFLTQPAVSNLLKQLEESFNAELTNVVGKTVYLTHAGEKLLDACIDIRHRLEKLEYDLSNLETSDVGSLSITVVTTAKYFIPKLLGNFKKDYPNIRFELHVVNRTAALSRLHENLDDFVIMSQPPKNKSLFIQDFFKDSLVVVASPDSRLADCKKINLEDLSEQEWIMREKGSGTKIAVDKIFKERKIKPNVTMLISNNESIKQLVAANMGISIIPLQSIELELKMGKIVILDVKGFPKKHEWYLVKNRSKEPSPIVNAFLKYIENYDKVNFNNII